MSLDSESRLLDGFDRVDDGEFAERRLISLDFPGAPAIVCRVCFTRPTLTPERVEVYEGRAFHRCPDCGGVSLIRLDDAVVLGLPY